MNFYRKLNQIHMLFLMLCLFAVNISAKRPNVTAWLETMMHDPSYRCTVRCMGVRIPPPTIPPDFVPVFNGTTIKRCNNQCSEDKLISRKIENCAINLATGCYVFKNTQTNYALGSQECKNIGMKLLGLETKRERNIIVSQIVQNKDNRMRFKYLTSATDFARTGEFRWDSSGAVVSPEMWFGGEPSAKVTCHCVSLHKATIGTDEGSFLVSNLKTIECALWEYQLICEK